MTNFTDEEKLSRLLRQAEPEIPVVRTQPILEALKKNSAAISLNCKRPANESTPSKTSRVFAVMTCVMVVVLVVLAVPTTQTTTGTTLAEFQAAKSESDILFNQLERLTAIDERLISQISTVDIRASESLWMLLQESESNTQDQRQRAELIVSLYARTPAAERCRRIFPDL